MKHISLKIFGKVQGVFFRVETKEHADRLGITGWVKNESDGTVMIEAEGDQEGLQKLLAWCKIGTRGSTVSKVEHEWSENLKNYQFFEIKY